MSIRKIPIAVRTHTVIQEVLNKPKYGSKKKDLRRLYGNRVMVLDTETTIDLYQNLNFGRAVIWENPNREKQVYENPILKEKYLFYADTLTPEQIQTLQAYATTEGSTLLTKNHFIYKVFFPEIWEYGTLLVGFNLPFDLSRIACSVKTFSHGKHKDEFEFKMCDSKYYPTLIIHPIDSKKSFISFKFSSQTKVQSQRKPSRQGRFLDLRTLVFALTNSSHSLDSACRLYKVENGKSNVDEHGVITEDYIYYNARDVQATFELYCKVKKEFDSHGLTRDGSPLEAGRIYSPASLGKAYMQEMNVLPFSETCPDFSKEILGYAMSSYYGGRSECHYRCSPVKVYHTDVVSMYPSVFTLQNLWSFVIAEELTVKEDTQTIQEFLNDITLEKLFTQEIWKEIPSLVQIIPNHDLLPVRGEYAHSGSKQIGLNYLTTETTLWYTLSDVIASKILTGKTPLIIKGLRLIPGSPQSTLNNVKLKGTIEVNPAKDNFFKKVIELRQGIKKQVKESGDSFDSMQMFLKILANSTSYGVYVELNREEKEEELELDTFSFEQHHVTLDKVEIAGKYYNPLIATMITGGARLVLSMIEQSTLDAGGNYAFCDTDSMSIIDLENDNPERIGTLVVDRFKSLYPYQDDSGKKSLLASEDYNWERKDWDKDTDKHNVKEGVYFPLYCYMVSAKRYVLYNLITDSNGKTKIVIRKKSDHGLGHLRSPKEGKRNEWVSTVWERIISFEHGLPFTPPVWFNEPALAQLSVSKPEIFKTLNREKGHSYQETIKPFNFMIIGYHAEENPMFHNERVQNFYCQQLKVIGQGGCTNKGKCTYRSSCLAELNKVVISPYSKTGDISSLKWMEKATKGSLKVQVSTNKLRVYDEIIGGIYEDEEIEEVKTEFIIKNYWDFIENYHRHPEVKYDNSMGEKCKANSLGLLQRCDVIPTLIKSIGKESNTLQEEEERLTLPDELASFENILDYEKKGVSQEKLYLNDWKQLQPILKEKAKPRQDWADKLGISRIYLQELISSKKVPSETLLEKIRMIGKKEKWEGVRLISVSKPKPTRFNQEDKGHIVRLEPLLKNLPDKETKREELKGYCFDLYGIEYIHLKTKELREILKCWNKKGDEEKKVSMMEKKKNFEATPVIIGSPLDKDKFLVEIPYNLIKKIRAIRKKGESYWVLQVKTEGGDEFKVLQKHNEIAIRCGYIPKASNLVKENVVCKTSNEVYTNYMSVSKNEGESHND